MASAFSPSTTKPCSKELRYNNSMQEHYGTFKEVKAAYTIEKWWHMPRHFSQSGDYVCFLSGNKECFKSWDEDGQDIYIVQERR